MKDKQNNFEQMVRREVQDFSSRPSDGFWMGLSGRLDTELGPPDSGTPAPPDCTGLPGTGLEHWLFQTLNINLITMITVGSLTLTVGMLFFTNSFGTSPNDSQNTAAVENPVEQADLIDTSFRSKDPLPDPVPSQKKTLLIPILKGDTLEKNQTGDETPASLLDFDTEKTSPVIENTRPTLSLPVEASEVENPCAMSVNLGDRIDPFRSELIALLTKNRRIVSGTYKLALLYSEREMTINDVRIEDPERQQYADLMQSYQISPCERRLVQVTDQYIAVGETTKEGFRGQFKGSADLEELNAHSKSLKFSGNAIINGTSNPGKDQILVLRKTDTRPDFDRLLDRLRSYGFKVKSSSYNQNDGLIDAIKIHLTHVDGLDWSLRTRNFDRIEFRVSLDKNGKVTDLTYQLNEEPFKKVGLTGTASISRTF